MFTQIIRARASSSVMACVDFASRDSAIFHNRGTHVKTRSHLRERGTRTGRMMAGEYCGPLRMWTDVAEGADLQP